MHFGQPDPKLFDLSRQQSQVVEILLFLKQILTSEHFLLIFIINESRLQIF